MSQAKTYKSRREMINDRPETFEEHDLTPVAIPEGYEQPESLEDLMRRVIRESISQSAVNSGMETFEEANDFDIPDDDEPDLTTPYTKAYDMAEQYLVEPDENPPTVPEQGHDTATAEPDGVEEPEANDTPPE
jgi:hypothetical protein